MPPIRESDLDRYYGTRYEIRHYPKDHTGVDLTVRFYPCGCAAFAHAGEREWYFDCPPEGCHIFRHSLSDAAPNTRARG